MAVRASHLRPTSTNVPADYDDEYLECRGEHEWQRIGMFHQGAEIRRLSICRRCKAAKYQRRTKHGEYLPTIYDRPEDYRIEGGVSKQEVWQEIINRGTVYQSEGTMAAAVRRKSTKLKVVK